MGKELTEKRVVIAGSKKTEEMSFLIEQQGGQPLIRSLQGMVILAENEVKKELLQNIDSKADWMIFTTGTGLGAMLHQAELLGIREAFVEIIRNSKVGLRGYKTLAAVKELDVAPVVVDEKGTLEDLVRALEPFDFERQGVVVQMHGEAPPELNRFFEKKGAVVRAILPYRHTPPETEVVKQLCDEIVKGVVDAVCFTTDVQVRYLFQYASNQGFSTYLKEAFRSKVIAASVGKITTKALHHAGVDRVISPTHERMGAMIIELAHYYQSAAITI